MLQQFWDPFIALLKQKETEVKKGDLTTEATDRVCPECSLPLVIKLGRSGKFLACSGFPACRHTEPLASNGSEETEAPVLSEEKCDKCGAQMLIKDGRFGKFLACSAYPACKNIQPLIKPISTGVACPECKEGELQEKKSRYGKIFYSCNRYPKCKFAAWDPPVAQSCPKCSYPILVEKVTKRDGTYRKCVKEGCDYRLQLVEPAAKATKAAAPAKKGTAKTATAAKKKPAVKAKAKK